MLKAVQKVRERHALKGDANQPLGSLVEEIARMVEGHPYQEGLRGWLLEPNSLASSYNRAEGSDVAVHSLALAASIRRKFLQAVGGPAPSAIFFPSDPPPSQQLAGPADQIVSQIEELFPNWRAYRDLIDCITCELHELRKDDQRDV